MHKIRVMIRKEWSEVFKNRFVFFAVAFMPLLFTAMPLIILYTSKDSGGSTAGMGEIPAEFSAMCDTTSGADCFQSFILSQFLMLFLMIPIIIPTTIASYSIVGEKTTRTLEPLLATPITTLELLAGKTLAATIPALAATWGSYLIFVFGTNAILSNPVVTGSLIEPLWLLAIFGVAPLLSIAGVSIAVMISSRVNDPRVAEQLSALVIMPLLLIFVGQTLGLIFVDQTVIIWIGLALTIIDAVLLYFASQIFQRETILTRWK